jgi:hypothetical protein
MADECDRIREFLAGWDEVDFQERRDALEGRVDLEDAGGGVGDFGRLHARLVDPAIRFDVSAVDAYSVLWPRGHGEGVGEWLSMWSSWFASWESIELGGSELTQVGDAVVEEFKAHMVGRGSGIEVDVHHFHRWGMRDGRIVSFTVHPSLESASE